MQVSTGTTVTVADGEDGHEQSYQLVVAHGDPAAGTLSVSSPIGRALQGHRVGEQVSVRVPHGERHLRILAIA